MRKICKTSQTMKKLFIVLICVTLFCSVNAQEQHLSFKGVPINGTLKEYTNAMVKAGFKSEGITKDGISLLSGDFAGYKGCIIGVSTLTNCDVVNRIAVLFPEKETWATLVYDYENLKSMLTKKYGAPDFNREEFTTYTGDNNGLKMHALNDDQVVWITSFSTELGDIELSIVGGAYCKGHVRLMYFDKVNSDRVEQSAMDDL